LWAKSPIAFSPCGRRGVLDDHMMYLASIEICCT
jgi:hypothetical protein